MSLCLTPANVADVTQAEDLLVRLRGLVVADAAYISTALRQKLWEIGILLLTPLRKNMKGLASPVVSTANLLEQLQQLKGRQIIEIVFSVLKGRLGLVSPLPRSLDGYLTHCVALLLAYQLSYWVSYALCQPRLSAP